MRFRVADAVGSFSSSTSLQDNLWHHVAINADRSGNATCYFDGVLDGTTIDISGEVSDDAGCADDITIGIQDGSADKTYDNRCIF